MEKYAGFLLILNQMYFEKTWCIKYTYLKILLEIIEIHTKTTSWIQESIQCYSKKSRLTSYKILISGNIFKRSYFLTKFHEIVDFYFYLQGKSWVNVFSKSYDLNTLISIPLFPAQTFRYNCTFRCQISFPNFIIKIL